VGDDDGAVGELMDRVLEGAQGVDVGTANVVAARLTDWFKGLWHGRSLAFTVAVFTVVVCLGYLFFTMEPPHEASGVDAGESDPERR